MQPSRACAVLCNPKRSACVFLLMQGLVCSCAVPRRQTPEHVRAAVLAPRGSGITNVAIANKYKLTEAGVRYIFKTYKDGDVSTRKRAGRPPKCSARCVCFVCLATCRNIHSVRYQRRLLQLNYNHPFWSAAQLVESLHAQTMKALLNRPSGAVVRVCSISVCTCLNKTFSDTVQGFCEDRPADHQCRRDCFCQSCMQAPSHKEAYNSRTGLPQTTPPAITFCLFRLSGFQFCQGCIQR